MSNLDCFNLCEESCLKCKTRKADSKYCRYCDVCNKECPAYIDSQMANSSLDSSSHNKRMTLGDLFYIDDNMKDISFNSISNFNELINYLVHRKFLQSFVIIMLILAIVVLVLSFNNFQEFKKIRSYFASGSQISNTNNLAGNSIVNKNISGNVPIPNINIKQVEIKDNYKAIFLFIISITFIFIGLNYIYGITLNDVSKTVNIFNNSDNKNHDDDDDDDDSNIISSILTVDDNKVYNVSSSLYSYNEAKALCKSFGAKLATPSQVYNSYQSGESWCEPSWSDGQNLLFPSQEIDVILANRDEKTAGSCGISGLNGYYESNPDQKHPVNCYGIPPAGVSIDTNSLSQLQDTHNSSTYNST